MSHTQDGAVGLMLSVVLARAMNVCSERDARSALSLMVGAYTDHFPESYGLRRSKRASAAAKAAGTPAGKKTKGHHAEHLVPKTWIVSWLLALPQTKLFPTAENIQSLKIDFSELLTRVEVTPDEHALLNLVDKGTMPQVYENGVLRDWRFGDDPFIRYRGVIDLDEDPASVIALAQRTKR
jgi:hypothetical protein